MSVSVEAGEAPEVCPYCEHPFASDQLWALHVGEEHEDVATAAEREAYREALDEETDRLFVFHLKVIAAIAFLYAGFVLAYMVVFS